MKTLIDTIRSKNIPHLIGVAVERPKNKELEGFTRDYFAIILQCDFLKHNASLSKFPHSISSDYPFCIEFSLEADDILQFKEESAMYLKVQHNENGRLYLQKGFDFLTPFKSEQRFYERKSRLLSIGMALNEAKTRYVHPKCKKIFITIENIRSFDNKTFAFESETLRLAINRYQKTVTEQQVRKFKRNVLRGEMIVING